MNFLSFQLRVEGVAVSLCIIFAVLVVPGVSASGRPGLLKAIRGGDTRPVRKFILNEGNLNFIDEQGLSPLHVAVKAETIKIVRLLLNAGANPNQLANGDRIFKAIFDYKVSPLHIAVREQNKKLVYLLLKNGAKPARKAPGGQSALERARSRDNVHITKLLEKGVGYWDVLEAQDDSLLRAIKSDSYSYAKKLIEAGIGLNTTSSKGETPLHLAAGRGRQKLVQMLLRQNVDTDVFDSWDLSPVDYAIRKGHLRTAKILSKAGVKIGKREIIRESDSKNEALFKAAHDCRENYVEFLLWQGGDPDRRNGAGKTPLMLAASYDDGVLYEGCTETCRKLLKYKADVNLQDHAGKTALHYSVASFTGRAEALMMIKHGAKINIQDKQGNTPLHLAASHKPPRPPEHLGDSIDGRRARRAQYSPGPLVELLAREGAALNLLNEAGFSPLMVAAKKGYLKMVKALVNAGAKIKKQTPRGKTALEIARNSQHQEVYEYLKRK